MKDKNIRFIIEKHYQEWINDEDWWFGLHDRDINIVDEENGTHSVVIYNVEHYFDEDGNEWGSTGNLILDKFIIND